VEQAMKTVTADKSTLSRGVSSQQKQTQDLFITQEASLEAVVVQLSRVEV
jgi:hypothetical protein